MANTLYASVDDLIDILGNGIVSGGLADDPTLAIAVAAASRWIDGECCRRFWLDDDVSVRTFRSTSSERVYVDDFATTDGLLISVDDNDDGAFETTWGETEYVLDRFSREQNGIDYPYTRISSVGTRCFPAYGRRDGIQVTAKWGWPVVPDPIRYATLLVAKDFFKAKDTVGGVAGFDQFGSVRVRTDPTILSLIEPFRIGWAFG